jgi:uncharacterized protein (DUF433 family)
MFQFRQTGVGPIFEAAILIYYTQNASSGTMTTLVSERLDEPWRRRLYLPSYQIGEAASYAKISAQTVVAWHKFERALLSQREKRAALSYMQLIEVAVVAAFRKSKVPLKRIQAARDYAKRVLRSEYPFAEYRFKEEAKHLWLDSGQIPDLHEGTVIQADQEGQLAWEEVIGRLQEFEYEHEGIVLKWHVAGLSSPIIIDPRISFGAPTVKGTPTWVIKGRWDAGESDSDIADDFGIQRDEVREALKFEGVVPGERGESRLH